ncbi:MAG: WD40/YVTN/BNR-like repeat-containing protein [Flavobacteriales bacterium]
MRCFSQLIVSIFILTCCTVACAQSDTVCVTEPEKNWEKQLLREGSHVEHNRNEILRVKKWHWECLGPNEQPAELHPGGLALPAYAKGRGNGTGRINYLYLHPKKQNRLWACSPTGGVWYTKNGGQKWLEGGTDKLAVSGASSVAVNLRNPRQWVLSSGDGDDQFTESTGLWRTKNNGHTYTCINGLDAQTSLPFGSGRGFISEVVCSPSDFNLLFTATSKGLWMCHDASNNKTLKWKRIAEGNFFDIEVIDRKDPDLDIVIAAGEKLMLSYNGGETWEELKAPTQEQNERFAFMRMSVSYSKALPGFAYIGLTCSERWESSPQGEGQLYLLDLKTKEWKHIRSLRDDMCNLIHTRARAFAASPVEPNLLMCGNVSPLYRSTDGGYNFSKIEKNQMHDDCHHIAFANDGKTAWATHDGGVSVSYDAGMTWQARDNGIGAANIFGVSTGQQKQPQVAYGGYDVGGNLLRNNKWWHVSWGDGFETITHPSNADVVFTTMQNGQLQRTDDGEHFDHGRNANAKTEWHTWIRMHPKENNIIYCAGALLKRSNDLGQTWETILDVRKQNPELYNAYKFYLSADHPNVMYAYCLDEKTKVNPKILRTFNLLETDASKIVWEQIDVPMNDWIASIVMDRDDAHKFHLLYSHPYSDKKLWFFDSIQYIDMSANLGHAICESMVMQSGDAQRIYIGSSYGVFTKIKNESEWTLLLGLPGTHIKSMDINYVDNKLLVGTFGRGVWQCNLLLSE